ncbi:MAG: flagellar biosynthetic protein FliO [Spirochaetaceae bacterium]|jgi:flagellar protein FliO/FliZ|nr:flagellar biosynthetic protein FliO [Spirochaetaceae bacterium]
MQHHLKILCIVFIATTFCNVRVLAQTDDNAIEDRERSFIIANDTGTVTTGSQALSVWTVFRTILVLAVVAVVIYGTIFFLKRIVRTSVKESPHLKVLAGASLVTGRSVHIVAVGTKAWLVGAAENGVSLIAEITDQETVDAMLLDASQRQSEISGKMLNFSRLLQDLTGSKEQKDKTPKTDSIRKNREKIRRLL